MGSDRTSHRALFIPAINYTELLSSGLWTMTTMVKLTSVPTTAWPTAFSLEAPARPPRAQNPNLRAAGHPGSWQAPPVRFLS